MSFLRKTLFKNAHTLGENDLRLSYYATLSEIQNGIFNKKELESRRNKFEDNKEYVFPDSISSIPVPIEGGIRGVSRGIAQGEVGVIDGELKKGMILFTKH